MKIAVRPVFTLATAASRSSAIECPLRHATNTAMSEQNTRAIWFGPAAAASPNRKKERPSSPTKATTGTNAGSKPRGLGLGGRENMSRFVRGAARGDLQLLPLRPTTQDSFYAPQPHSAEE